MLSQIGDVVASYSSGPPGHAGTAVGPYAHGIAALVLAAAAAAGIALCVTTPSFEVGIGTLFALGMGQSLVFWSARSTPLNYRVMSSIALFMAFAAAFLPRLLSMTPLRLGAALALAAVASLPMWAVAIWRLIGARREVAGR